jgi:hypothetical protein
MVVSMGVAGNGMRARKVVPSVMEVRVPGADVIIEMGGEPWRLMAARRDPFLALLVRMPTG